MERISTTPFGRRPVTAGLLATEALARTGAPVPEADKWAVFHDLRLARAVFRVTDRDLTVLNALLSFLPERSLRDGESLIVHPSNATLADRAHGMAESTLRRHLAALVAAGLVLRHDSPNGKRYASRDRSGEVIRAFGFDLRPLLVRAEEIAEAARAAEAAALRLRLDREAAMLRLRDAQKLLEYVLGEGLAGDWASVAAELAEAGRALRRVLGPGEAAGIRAVLEALLGRFRTAIEGEAHPETEETDGTAAGSGRHQQNSNPESHEPEPCLEQAGATVAPPILPLGLVLKACPDILTYARGPVRHWHELVAVAGDVRPMLGISPDAWEEAGRLMGREVAAIALAGILQRASEIRKPGGYLRSLAARSAAGEFSPGPMIMALLNAENRRPA